MASDYKALSKLRRRSLDVNLAVSRSRFWIALCFLIFFLIQCWTYLGLQGWQFGNGFQSTIIDRKALFVQSTSRIDRFESCESLHNRSQSLPNVKWMYVQQVTGDVVLEGWEDDWISEGILADGLHLQPPKLDIAYTFVEADERYLTMRKNYKEDGVYRKPDVTMESLSRRHRAWDELRYSVRGVLRHAATWLGSIHIVAKDYIDTTDNSTVVQYPKWLNRSVSQFNTTELRIVSETSVVDNGQCGPTFNSISIEASLVNLNMTSSHFIGMSDDMLFGKEMSASDFYSPLYGVSFQQYAPKWWPINVATLPDLPSEPDGELTPAYYTSYLLNQRFGSRPRHLQQHLPKAINQHIMQEAMQSFPGPALKTPLSRFRSDSHQLYPWYLHMWYTIEMHREALLWAISMRADDDEDSFLTFEERQDLIRQIESGVRQSKRSDRLTAIGSRMNFNLERVGLQPLMAERSIWTSMDGPSTTQFLAPHTCLLDSNYDKCLGPQFVANGSYPTHEFFLHLSSAPTWCGDCLIQALLGNSEAALSPLLPRSKTSKSRQMAVQAIHKYQYYLSWPDQVFLMITGEDDARHKFSKYRQNFPALVCINDDIVNATSEQIRGIAKQYKELYESNLPDPSPFENTSLELDETVTRPNIEVTGEQAEIDIIKSVAELSDSPSVPEAAANEAEFHAMLEPLSDAELSQDSETASKSRRKRSSMMDKRHRRSVLRHRQTPREAMDVMLLATGRYRMHE